MYCDHIKIVFYLLKYISAGIPTSWIGYESNIFFLNSEYFNYNGMYVRKIYLVKVSLDNIDLSDLIAKQAEFSCDIIQSIWYLQDKVACTGMRAAS